MNVDVRDIAPASHALPSRVDETRRRQVFFGNAHALYGG
jgi:hypothetical protein